MYIITLSDSNHYVSSCCRLSSRISPKTRSSCVVIFTLSYVLSTISNRMTKSLYKHRFIRAQKTIYFRFVRRFLQHIKFERLRCLNNPKCFAVYRFLNDSNRRQLHCIFCLHTGNCRTRFAACLTSAVMTERRMNGRAAS